MKRFTMIASGYAFFIRKGKILLSRRKNTGYRDGYYSLPAGHIEENETVTDGTCRELQEETGIVLLPSQLRLVHVMHRHEDDIRMDFFFLVSGTYQDPKNTEPDKCGDLSWFPLTKLPKNTIPYIAYAISQYRHHALYSEFGWN